MNVRHLLKYFLPVITFALFGVSGCAGGISSRTMSWQEEVLLHDGRIVIAERHYKLGGYSTPASTDRTAVNQTVTFTVPGLKQRIVWETDFRDSVPEPNSLNLLLFDVVKDIPYIATYPAGCIAYNKWQRPNPPYVLFKYEQGRWQRISMVEFPGELKTTNVIVGRPATELLKSYYTTEGVEARNYYLEPQYKSILRGLFSKERLETMCEERVLYKGYWILPNDPVARNMIDQREKQGQQK